MLSNTINKTLVDDSHLLSLSLSLLHSEEHSVEHTQRQSHIHVFDQETATGSTVLKLNHQDVPPRQDRRTLGIRFTNLGSGTARAMEEIPEEKDEHSPPKKPNIKPR